MARNDYRSMLLQRMEKTFSNWSDTEHVKEQELYRFLHTMKGTSGTIGMTDLARFCSGQLDTLTETSDALIPVRSLKNFISLMRNFFVQDSTPIQVHTSTNLTSAENNDSFVLIIDDDLEFVSYVKENLEKSGIQVVIALDGKKGLELFYTLLPNMLIVDIQLPDMNGFDILAQIGDIARSRYVPIAIVSGDNSKENITRAYTMGAMDFVIKPIDMSVFIPYVHNRLQYKKAIWQSASIDELTGAGNRRQFNDTFAQFSALAERTRRSFTLVMMDLDHFKKVNDHYGHPMGDDVLRSFSRVVLNMKRETDFFFRYGGEEFALLLMDTTPDESIILVERIREKIADITFTAPSSEPFHVTFSAGASEYRINPEILLNEADQALYQAKRNGRNQTVIYQLNNSDVKRHLNVMIIDDDLLVRTMLVKQFSNWTSDDMDIVVHEYPDGYSFLESDWYKADENYMILLDGMMPKMDGIEVLSTLRKRYPDDNIIVSMLTGRTSESDIILALKKGADDYIIKPFHPQEVLARVQRLTERLIK
ncbi:diguanylate cyclase [Domibacillus mangrovi]|uniref:Diguanylate cyclase n=1 Tax=Domibacillus mangrovi TaxID=1714354 RepID=A0A1Q5NZR3_9BACI|nr:diguanylate cyclase [Domibacillus mangrovi]OKL35510.1 diguanylate cyclase [Domibacillus mangrovi]